MRQGDYRFIVAEMVINKYGKHSCKVVLTGGPCSGKTTAIKQLEERILADELNVNWKVFTVSEAATFLYSGGVGRCEMSDEQTRQWQKGIMEVMLRFEAAYEHIAEEERNKHTLMLCDRGGMDPKVFTTSQLQWESILRTLKLDESRIMERYDCVIRLHTAPNEYYNHFDSTNIYRREKEHDEAVQVDAKYNELWNRHPNYNDIPNPISLPRLDDCSARAADSESPWENEWNSKFEEIYNVVRRTMDSQFQDYYGRKERESKTPC